MLGEYAFVSGLSVLSTRTLDDQGLVTSTYKDLSSLARSRILQAKAALASQIYPPLLEPDRLSPRSSVDFRSHF